MIKHAPRYFAVRREVAGEVEDEVGGVRGESIDGPVRGEHNDHMGRNGSVTCIQGRDYGLRYSGRPQGQVNQICRKAQPSRSKRTLGRWPRARASTIPRLSRSKSSRRLETAFSSAKPETQHPTTSNSKKLRQTIPHATVLRHRQLNVAM